MTRVQPAEDGVFIEKSTMLLNAMANPGRLKILRILVETETSVGQLSERVSMSQSALSQHLAKLRGAKLVSTRRDAQTIYYRCHSDAVSKILSILAVIVRPRRCRADHQRRKKFGGGLSKVWIATNLRTTQEFSNMDQCLRGDGI